MFDIRIWSLIVAILLCTGYSALAEDNWYEKQMPTQETLAEYHIAWKSCCNHGDVCKTCVVHQTASKPPWRDSYWYKDGDGPMKQLPGHIVEYVPWTPTGKPVLFLAPFGAGDMKAGDPVCLKVPGGAT